MNNYSRRLNRHAISRDEIATPWPRASGSCKGHDHCQRALSATRGRPEACAATRPYPARAKEAWPTVWHPTSAADPLITVGFQEHSTVGSMRWGGRINPNENCSILHVSSRRSKLFFPEFRIFLRAWELN